MKPFLTALSERVLVCDGAMGTMLYGRGVFINRCFESLTLSDPDLVRDVHRQYLRAGADVIETNTFGANRMKLRAFGLGNRVAELNTAAARLAREVRDAAPANGGRAYVAGAIGPLGVRVEPWGKTGVDEAEALFREQAEALVAGGVELFVLETFRDLNEIGAAIAAVRRVSSLPIVAQMTTEEDGNSLDGTPPEQFAPVLLERGASVVGVNCSVGPAPMLESIERLAAALGDVRLSAMPNAGRPRDIEGRNIYLCSPEYMASYARRFIGAGVRLVGGCCGTTPEHIRQISAAVDGLPPRVIPTREPRPRWSGLEPFEIGPDTGFVMIGERTNVTGSARFRSLVEADDLEAAVEVALEQVRSGANALDVNMDADLLDGERTMTRFLNLLATEPEAARLPIMVDSSRWSVLEAGLKCLQGKGVVNSISLKEGEEPFLEQARRIRRYGAGVVVMAFDEQGQAT